MSGAGRVSSALRAIVVAGGDVPSRMVLDAAWPGWDAGATWVVAADGGAAAALALGLRPDLVIGDLDSITPGDLELVRSLGIPVEAWPPDKDASDSELALRAALDRGPGPVTILGALGGSRVDHALANIWLLALPAADREVWLINGHSRLRLLAGPGHASLRGGRGDLVTLLAFDGSADGVSTEGLAWPLHDATLTAGPSRGLSNERAGSEASVSLRAGRLLIIETHIEGASS